LAYKIGYVINNNIDNGNGFRNNDNEIQTHKTPQQ
jgi:hypothetical protein